MVWAHVACQITAILVGVAAGWVGLSLRRRSLSRQPRAANAGGRDLSRRRHVVLGSTCAVILALGYGLGVWAVHGTGRDVLTGTHALVGTVAAMFVAVTVFLGTALVSRDDDRLARLHRLIGLAACVLLAIQGAVGISILAGW